MAHIVVLDDEKSVRDVITAVLECSGHVVSGASDRHSVFEVLRDHPADLILVDLVLPSEGIGQTLQTLHESLPSVPIIAMSGLMDAANEKRAKSFGAVACLWKPFSVDDLVRTVNRILGKAA